MKQHKTQFFTAITKTESENRHKQNRGTGATRQALRRPCTLRAGLSFQGIGGLVLSSFTLRRRRDKLHLLGIATLRSSPLVHVHKAQVGLKIPVIQKFAYKGHLSGLADSPAPWPRLHQPRPSPVDAVAPSFRFRGPLDLRAASHSVSNIEKRVPPAASTLQWPLPLWRRHQPCPSPPRRPLGGPKPQGPPSPRI
ncbi:hypothetical protein Cgig2_009054 [Carnegiea gigantea]|uniref:Uncharacterized protein n=1 Tax=Carnegiea gigantea TaxID=171969 RepID=A0A9Q1KMT0_9CARY|nr:hypothetical protein Cgig2_009054 [Carnegiea gigantea]